MLKEYMWTSRMDVPIQGGLFFIQPPFFSRPFEINPSVDATEASMLCKGVPRSNESQFKPRDGASAGLDGEGTLAYQA